MRKKRNDEAPSLYDALSVLQTPMVKFALDPLGGFHGFPHPCHTEQIENGPAWLLSLDSILYTYSNVVVFVYNIHPCNQDRLDSCIVVSCYEFLYFVDSILISQC